MSLLIEAIAAFFLGMTLLFLAPILTLGVLRGWFVELALNCVGRAILLKRLNGGFILKASRFNAADGTEQISMGGDTYDFADPANMMSRLRGKPFAIAHEKRASIVDPVIADVSRRVAQHKEDGTFERSGRVRRHLELEPGPTTVDVEHGTKAVQGSTPPHRSEMIRKFTKKGQSQFNTSRAAAYVIWLIALGAGAFIPYLLLQLKDSVGDQSFGAAVPGFVLPPGVVDALLVGL